MQALFAYATKLHISTCIGSFSRKIWGSHIAKNEAIRSACEGEKRRVKTMAESAVDKKEFVARCHCGKVQGLFRCSADTIYALDCNCSDCNMRKNAHFVVPAAADFTLLHPETYEDDTTLYQWGSKTAIRRFCKTCGILPWYTPRSNPDGYAITLHCVDWTAAASSTGDGTPPTIITERFDGVHWEDSIKAFNDDSREVKISSFSKK